ADNFNAFGSIGRLSGATGDLIIQDGGKLLMTGNALSTVADSRTTALNIGGFSDTVAGGVGRATVTGPGSEIRVTGSDGFIAVGRGPGAVGQLALSNQASVTTMVINVGRVGTGTLTMDNATMTLSGQQTGSVLSGAALSIGNRGGTGAMT